MKRTLIVSAAVIVVVAIAVAAGLLTRDGTSQATATTVAAPVQTETVVADGTVLPVERAELAFPVAGRVSAVLVEEGDMVTAGQPLLTLTDAAAQAALAAAQAEVGAAEAALEEAAAGAAAANAAVVKAEATRDGLSDGAADWRVDAAGADLDLAQAQVRAADAGVSGAEARLAAARAKVRQTQATLDELSIAAPLAGTVVSVDAKVGDQVAPSLVVVRVADLSTWEIVTTDLDEASVASLAAGMPATLTLDALPGMSADGTVTRVGLVGRPYQGTTVYAVTVVPAGAIDGLRWGLTATVTVRLR